MASIQYIQDIRQVASKETEKKRKEAYSQYLIVGTMFLMLLPVLMLLSASRQPATHDAEALLNRRLSDSAAVDTSAAHLFTTAAFTVVGPSTFPKPSDLIGEDALPNLQPTFGKHRATEDALFVLAVEYKLNTYLCFVESLRATGYKGDIVFALSILDIKEKGVEQYLKDTPHIVTYVLELNCFNAEMEATSSSKGGMRVCQLHHLYADAQGKPLDDPREARTIATTRYELYWLWCLNYQPHVWIMLLDARDSYFQTNPFDTVPREAGERKSGMLHFFGVRISGFLCVLRAHMLTYSFLHTLLL